MDNLDELGKGDLEIDDNKYALHLIREIEFLKVTNIKLMAMTEAILDSIPEFDKEVVIAKTKERLKDIQSEVNSEFMTIFSKITK